MKPDVPEEWKKRHNAHGPSMVKPIGPDFFDPRVHCFKCRDDYKKEIAKDNQ